MTSELRRVSQSVRRLSSKVKSWQNSFRPSLEGFTPEEEKEAADTGLGANFFYSDDTPELQLVPGKDELPRSIAKFHRVSGFDFNKPYNVVWINKVEVVYVVGHVAIVINVHTKAQRLIHGRDDGGIAWVAPSTGDIASYIAIAEKSSSSSPRVFIYKTTPSADTVIAPLPYRILRDGTEKAYACVAFSPHVFTQMATLGKAPDYMLTIWHWRKEQVLLKCKAYGQDIFQVKWGQFPGQLITAGTGHIRFWKMATTFSGLKLQGEMGKFGQAELSDVFSFVEMPDGKLLTGSENGKILVWEGVFVKCELVKQLEGNGPLSGSARYPHIGPIDAVVVEGENLVSGGHDGYLRWWSMADIDICEADYDSGHIEVEMTANRDFFIPPTASPNTPYPAHIQYIAPSANNSLWAIQDGKNGCVWIWNRDNGEMSRLLFAHSRSLTRAILCPKLPGLCVTAGVDGTLRAQNYSQPETTLAESVLLDTTSRPSVTSITLLPPELDVHQCTFAVGYADGVVRFFSMAQSGFALLRVTKPHNSAVTHMAYSADASWFCTVSSNNTLFFSEVRRTSPIPEVPVGFLSLPCKVHKLLWNNRLGGVLVTLEDGLLVEVVCPITEDIDNSESYEIRLKYRSISPDIVHPIEEQTIESDDASDIPDAQVDDAAKTQEAEVKDEVDTLGAITEAVYLSNEVVLFTGTGRFAGNLWEVNFDGCIQMTQPLNAHTPSLVSCSSRSKFPHKVHVTFMEISGKLMLLGFQGGNAWILSLDMLSSYVDIRLPDSDIGVIRSISLSPDTKELVLAAGDGGLFVLNFNYPGFQAALDVQRTKKDDPTLGETISSLETPFVEYTTWEFPDGKHENVEDITSAAHFSIQDAKLKSEEENVRAAAEKQKEHVRQQVKDLRKELETLRAKNEALGLLDHDAYIVDFNYVAQLEAEKEQKLLKVEQRMAWEVETSTLLVNKLLDRYLEVVDFDYLEVTGFRTGTASTFRSAKMSAHLQENLAQLHELLFDLSDSESDADIKDKNQDHRARVSSVDADLKEVNLAELSSAQLREHRKQQRLMRKRKIEEVEKAKPQKDQGDDPRDIEAILEAERTLGNYTLKMAADYKVPESQRMNWEKKRRQMFLLDESIHAIKTEFNQRVLSLRTFKQQVKENLLKEVETLEDVEKQLRLGVSYQWLRAQITAPFSVTEYPEIRLDISPAELAMACGETVEDTVDEPTRDMRYDSYLARRRRLRNDALDHPENATNPLALAMKEECVARLKYDRSQLVERIETIITTFDDAVSSLGKEKIRLCSDIKNADMKLLTLYDELLMLNELEEMDCKLLKNSADCRQERTSAMFQIKECQNSLSGKKAEIELWEQEEAMLQNEFTELIGENSPFLATLLKIYKKKVKRSKRKKNDDDDDLNEDEEESEEESDLDSDEDDDEVEEDMCPQGCDITIYESIIELRDKRLDMEDALIEIQKSVEELKRTHQRLLQEEKKIEKEQKSLDDEIQKFQTEKQQKLNQVGIVFGLRLSQFQCITNGMLPETLDTNVVFTSARLVQLRERIMQLHHEKYHARQNHKQLRRDYVTRYKEKKSVQMKIEDLDFRFHDIQLLKFGRTVDLDLIEKGAPSKYVRELQGKVKDLEKEADRKQDKWEKKLEENQKILSEITMQNSGLMDQIVKMGYSQLQLDSILNARIANVTVNDQEPTLELKEVERERMGELLSLQSKEIATLQAEINIFRKKGGHIYTTVTANRLPAKT